MGSCSAPGCPWDRFFEGKSDVVGRQKKGKVKTKLKLKSSKSEVFYPADLCMPKVKAPDSEEEVVTDRNNSKNKDDP